jgi:hypothetical protein
MPIKQDELIHKQFIITLKEQGLTVRTANEVSSIVDDKNFAAAIRILGDNHRNIYFLTCQNKVVIIHLHIRSEESGFWGLTKSTLDHLKLFKEKLKIPYLLVLLVGRQDKFIADGYIIPEVGKSPMTRQLTLLANGGYKINEKQDLNSGKKIRSIKMIVHQIQKLILN